MNGKLRIPLLAAIILAVSLPAGFAIAQVVGSESESDRPPINHVDPDPSTDPIKLDEELKEAQAPGDPKARATPEPDVPAGTYAYLNPAINDVQINQCRGWLDEGRRDELCELIVLYGEGRVEAGPYTKAEVQAILSSKGETR